MAKYIRSKWYGEIFLSLSVGKRKMRLGVWNGSTWNCVSLSSHYLPIYTPVNGKQGKVRLHLHRKKMNMLKACSSEITIMSCERRSQRCFLYPFALDIRLENKDRQANNILICEQSIESAAVASRPPMFAFLMGQKVCLCRSAAKWFLRDKCKHVASMKGCVESSFCFSSVSCQIRECRRREGKLFGLLAFFC